jgi:hypothetical protein
MLHLLPNDVTNQIEPTQFRIEGQTHTELELEAWLIKLGEGKRKKMKDGLRSLDQKAREGEMFSIFFEAVRIQASPHILRFLALELEEADVYVTPRGDDLLYNPLHYAAAYCVRETVTALVDLGADPNWCCDYKGWTPLLAAGHNKDPEVIHVLVRSGGNIFAKNYQGNDLLDFASTTWTARKTVNHIMARERALQLHNKLPSDILHIVYQFMCPKEALWADDYHKVKQYIKDGRRDGVYDTRSCS